MVTKQRSGRRESGCGHPDSDSVGHEQSVSSVSYFYINICNTLIIYVLSLAWLFLPPTYSIISYGKATMASNEAYFTSLRDNPWK